MTRARVLVVDDSVVVRRTLGRVLEADPEIEFVGSADGARQALPRIQELQPDFVILDVEMPEVSGLEAIPLIRHAAPDARIIMYSGLTARGASITLDALALGAADYVAKPSGVTGSVQAEARIRTELLGKIKGLWRRDAVAPRRPYGTTVPMTHAPASARAEIVAIGASTGGPNALVEVLGRLRPTFSAPILIVQHMPPVFTRLLAERIAQRTGRSCVEARDGDEVAPHRVYLAPGDHHMVVARSGSRVVVRLNHEQAENYCRPSVDVLLRSLAPIYGARALAVILTGMGQDGSRGCRDIVVAGGQVLAQDKGSSVVWGMPGQVISTGLADEVVPLSDMAEGIRRRVAPAMERVGRVHAG
jgi:two-component system chemotaxis response regulator CheB